MNDLLNRILQHIPKILYVLVIGILLFDGINFSLCQKRNHIYSDAEGYFLYLPAWFIHGGFSELTVRTKGQYLKQESTGNHFTKYSMGVAIAELPAFLVTDIVQRKILKNVSNGNELTYSRSIAISGWLAFIIGMMALMKWLSRSFKTIDVFLALILIALGTNLMYYALREPGASHIYSFTLFSLSALMIDSCYRDNRIKWIQATILGLLFSWIILIRPTNIIFLLFLLLYFPTGKFNGRARLNFLIKNWLKFIPFVLLSLGLWYAQLYQWELMRGPTSAYSYTNEGFIYWRHPKVLRVLLDVQNGLLIYSPVIWISLYGLFRYFNEKAATSRLIFSIFFIITVVFGSWWAWWFGGAYGHRCYVEFYVILVIPLLWVIEQINASKERIILFLFYALALLMLYYSIGLTKAYRSPWDGPKWNWHQLDEIIKNLF